MLCNLPVSFQIDHFFLAICVALVSYFGLLPLPMKKNISYKAVVHYWLSYLDCILKLGFVAEEQRLPLLVGNKYRTVNTQFFVKPYSSIHLGGERYCYGSKVYCPEQNAVPRQLDTKSSTL